jgi:hypothetical protein
MLCWLVVFFDLHSVISCKFERSFKGDTTLSTYVLPTSGAPWSKTGLSCASSLRFRILGCDVPWSKTGLFLRFLFIMDQKQIS